MALGNISDVFGRASELIKKASEEDSKAQTSADEIIDDFVRKYRSVDNDTRSKINSGINNILNSENNNSQNTSSTEGDFFKKFAESIREAVKNSKQTEQTNQATDTVADEDIYEYTYTPGDTFGRVLMKMGLSDGRNLWGPGGDVEYYTNQLHDQGIYGNIPIGTTIRLRKRGWENRPQGKQYMVPDAITGQMISGQRRA